VLDRFINEGLLVTGATPESIELAHEALIRTWPSLSSWVEEAREDLLRLEQFELALAQWRGNREAILDGLHLVEAEVLAGKGYDALSGKDARELLDSSRQARDDAVARERERQQAVRVSESLRLASEARESSDVEPEIALLVAWESLLWDRNEVSEAIFRDTLSRMPSPVVILRRPREDFPFPSTGFVGSGNVVFAASLGNGDIDVWDARGIGIGHYSIPGSGPFAAAAVPGHTALVTYRERVVRLHALNMQVLHQLALTSGLKDKWPRDIDLQIEKDGTCLLHHEGQAWVFVVERDRNQLRFIRPLLFKVEKYRSQSDLDGPLHDPFANVFRASLDPSGKRVLTEGSDSARVWDIEGNLQAVLKDSEGSGFASGSFLADGRIVTGTMRGAGQLWTASGESLGVFKPTASLDLFILAVHPDGLHFAATVNNSSVIEVWNASGELVSTLRGHKKHAWSASFSADGHTLASGSADRTARVWDWRAQRQILELHGNNATVHKVDFDSSGGALLGACHDGSVRLWTLDAPLLPALLGHQKGANKVMRTSAGILSSEPNASSRLWRADGTAALLSGSVLEYVTAKASTPAAAVTIDSSGIVRLWRLPPQPEAPPRSRCEIRVFSTAKKAERVVVSPDQTSLLLANENTAELWSASGERMARLVGANDEHVDQSWMMICGMGYRPDSRAIFTAAKNGMVWLWSADGSFTRSFVADYASPDRIFQTDVDPQSEYILVGVRNRASLWTWAAELQLELPSQGYKVFQVAFSPTGSRIITIADNPSGRPNAWCELWDRTGEHVAVLEMPEAQPNSNVYFEDNERYFCLKALETVRVFEFNGQQLGMLAGARGAYVGDVAISPDGNNIAVSFSDGMVRIWSFDDRRRVMTLRVGVANCILFSADGRRLLVATPSGPVQQHALDVTELYPAAASRLDRGFTRDELDRFGIQRPARLNIESFRS
jgi:WD40 repeat protein